MTAKMAIFPFRNFAEKPLSRGEWLDYATCMKSLHIRDVPEPTIARLKRRALVHHRSLQGELIFVLEEAAKQIPHEEPAEFSLNTVKTKGAQNWSREVIYECHDCRTPSA